MIVDKKVDKQYVGFYLIDNSQDGVKIATTKKPNLFNRIMFRIFFGWSWKKINK